MVVNVRCKVQNLSDTKGRNELKMEPNTIYNVICKVYGDNEFSDRLV